MARKAGSSDSGKSIYLIAVLVFFVFAFVMTLIIAILFNSDRDRARIAEADAISKRKIVITDDELASAEVVDLKNRAAETSKATGGKPLSITSFLLKEKQWYVSRITGTQSDTPAIVRGKLQRADVGEDTFLLGVIERLKAERADNDQQIARYKEASEKATAELTKVQEGQREKSGQQQAVLDTLKTNLAAVQAKNEEYQKASDAEVAKIQGMLAKSREDSQKEILTTRTLVDQKDREIGELQKRIKALTELRGGDKKSDVVDPSLLADGKIISILQEENLVYIDIGRQSHVMAGLTFEVFDKALGRAVKDANGEFRGKATIEVINVLTDSSVCRVVRRARAANNVYAADMAGVTRGGGGIGTRYALIGEGDIIVNAVYDPNYKFKFLVFGEYDIDNTGSATTADRRRIETTIREWGGVLADEISYDLDFLVLGAEPKLPDPLPGDETDEQKIKIFTQSKKKYEQYQNLIATARQLAIPILNQNRFLALIGYYRR